MECTFFCQSRVEVLQCALRDLGLREAVPLVLLSSELPLTFQEKKLFKNSTYSSLMNTRFWHNKTEQQWISLEDCS